MTQPTAPTVPQLGASTTNRKWLYEINTAASGSTATYKACGGLMNSKFSPDAPNWVDNTDQAGKGFQSQNKSGGTWSGEITVDRKTGKTDPTTYDVVQEFLRLKSIGKFGPTNTIELRVFEYDLSDPTGVASPRIEAYHGFAGVSWEPEGGDMMADDTVKITLTGQGTLDIIVHPYPKTA